MMLQDRLLDVKVGKNVADRVCYDAIVMTLRVAYSRLTCGYTLQHIIVKKMHQPALCAMIA